MQPSLPVYVGVGFSISDRDLGSTIAEAQARIETQCIASLRPENGVQYSATNHTRCNFEQIFREILYRFHIGCLHLFFL